MSDWSHKMYLEHTDYSFEVRINDTGGEEVPKYGEKMEELNLPEV